MIIGLQIIALFFSIFLIYLAILHHRRNELNKLEMISWVTIWVGVSVVVIFPDLLRNFAKNFLITRLFDLMVVGGFIVVIFMSYISYVKIKRMEDKIEKFVRRDAFKETKKNRK